MMFKVIESLRKEFKLLFRDIGGLLTLFVMPIVLVILMTSIQDSTYQTIGASKIPVLWLDQDQDSISFQIKKELSESQNFELVESLNGKELSATTINTKVFDGSYQMGIIIPKDLTSNLNAKVRQNVDALLEEMGLSTTTYQPIEVDAKEIQLFFDPATQVSFKNGMKSSIDKMILALENKSIYQTFEQQLGSAIQTDQNSSITFKEVVPQAEDKDIIPTSVQHNVPAWTLFAVFFIIIPLSINIVKEKNQGTYLRILSSPSSHLLLYLGKFITYLIICLMQFYVILLVAKLIFPLINLPDLELSYMQLLYMSLITLSAGFTAISLGILIGMIAKTQEQASPFGATLTVILAAIGGIWVPVFVMSETMQTLSKISPMHWALNAYYDILLRNGSIIDIIPEMLYLILFSIFFIGIAWIYDKKKRTI